MCLPSKNIKLCTCESSSIPKNNYWVLLTKRETEDFIVGECVFDYRTNEKSYKIIHAELEKKLNSCYPFDQAIKLEKNDILNINIPTDGYPNGEIFSFIFKHSKWIAFISDFFTEYTYFEKLKGKVDKLG